MAGENESLPYVADNSSGIGNAVVNPVVNPLAEQNIQNTGNTTAVDYAIQENKAQLAKKAQDNATFLAGLHPDMKGIMEEDTPYFQKKGQELLDLAQQGVAAGGDIKNPSNPYYWKIQSAVNGLTSEIEMSKGQKTDLLKNTTPFITKPNDYDQDSTGANITKYRMAGNPILRNQMSSEGLLVSSIPPMTKLVNDAFSGPIEKQQDVSATQEKNPDGSITTNTETGYNPERINAVVKANYAGKDGMYVDKNYDKYTTPAEKIQYRQQSDMLAATTGETVSPQELYYRKTAAGLVANKQGVKTQFDPANSARITAAAKNENPDDYAKRLLEGLSEMVKNPDNAFGPPTPITRAGVNPATLGLSTLLPDGEILKNMPRHSQLQVDFGNATMPVYGKDADGQVDYGNLLREQSLPNKLLDIMEVNGKLYYQTVQSQQQALSPDLRQKYGVDKSGYKPLDLNHAPDEFVYGAKDPIAVKAALRRVGQQMGLYSNGVFTIDKGQQQTATPDVNALRQKYNY